MGVTVTNLRSEDSACIKSRKALLESLEAANAKIAELKGQLDVAAQGRTDGPEITPLREITAEKKDRIRVLEHEVIHYATQVAALYGRLDRIREVVQDTTILYVDIPCLVGEILDEDSV